MVQQLEQKLVVQVWPEVPQTPAAEMNNEPGVMLSISLSVVPLGQGEK